MYVNIDFPSIELMVRDYIIEQSSRAWNSTQILRAVNDEYGKLCRAAINEDLGYFVETYTWSSLTSNTLTLPRNLYKIRSTEVYKNSRWRKIYPIGAHKVHEITPSEGATKHALGYRLTSLSLILEPGYEGITQVRIRYSRMPSPILYGQASAGAATSITYDSNASAIDDAYNNDEIMITSGTGSGQVNTVSDYDGGTRVATVTTWGTNPDSTSYYSTMLAPPVSGFPELVAKGAAMRLLYKKRDSEQIQMLAALYTAEYEEYLNSLIPRASDEPQYVNYSEEEDYQYWEVI